MAKDGEVMEGRARRLAPQEAEAGGRTRLSSVATAIRLLKAFRPEDRELGISELAKRLGVSKSTVHRLASTLLSEGLLEQNPDTERYRLGVTLFTLGTMVRRRMDISAEAKIHLLDLRAEVKENVRLAVLDGAQVLFVYDFESPHAVRLKSQTGLAKPAWCTAEGWVLLASRPREEAEAALPREPRPVAPNTPTSREEIIARLDDAARVGWALEDEESEPGMRAVATAVRGGDGRAMAAISVAAPRVRLRKRLVPQVSQRLMQTAEAISARLGWRG